MHLKEAPAHIKQGNLAEEIAATFLQRHGLTLLVRNFRCKYGEIDLVMRDASTLIFVEVRLRSSKKFGGAAMSITQSKQDKLSRSAEFFLQTQGKQYHDSACRFDAILMQSTDGNTVEWIKNAF